MLENTLKFDNLPTAINKTTNDMLAYTATSTLFQSTRSSTLINRFLKLVMDGEEEKAKQLLLMNPELSMMTGTATDFSGRTATTTAWRYAIWAWDMPMCHMMLNCLTNSPKKETIEQELFLQYTTHMETGLCYTLNGETFHSIHFDLSIIINALQNYSESYEHWNSRIKTFPYSEHYEDGDAERRKDWLKPMKYWTEIIGGAQRSFPAYIAQHYTFTLGQDSRRTSICSFLTHAEKEKTFYRNLYVSEKISPAGTTDRIHWFALPSSDPKRASLGVNSGIYLDSYACEMMGDNSSVYHAPSHKTEFHPCFGTTRGVNNAKCLSGQSGHDVENIDLPMLKDLQTTNKQDLVLLHERLSLSLQQEAVCSCVIC